MNNRDLVYKLMKENAGILTSKVAGDNGIDNKVLQRLCNTGDIERISRGIYLDANFIEDEYFVMQLRCKQCIFSHETALYLHGLSDRNPIELTVTVPSGHNTRLMEEKEKYSFFYIKKELHDMGLISVKSSFGNSIEVYDIERTICDCIKKRNELDSDLVISAIKEYMNLSNKNLPKLLEYADKLNVRREVKQYMEVLL
ncbi:MAG: abortive phage infection protein [Clostridiales bacterium]|nr:abortive phage infection protein [Clostridiales bacterium]